MKNLQFLLDSQTDSKIFYWMRTFALIAVVMAHATFVHPDSQVLDRLLASFLDCGVAVFFFAAGALFQLLGSALLDCFLLGYYWDR